MNTDYKFDERKELEFLLRRHKDLHRQLDHEHLLFREAAAEGILGSVFAGAPTSMGELNEHSISRPVWKKVLHASGSGYETLEDVTRVTPHVSNYYEDSGDDSPILSDRERVEAIEHRKECYRGEYQRLNNLKNELLAQVSLSDDQGLVNSLLKDVRQIEVMQSKIEKRLEWTIAGPEGDVQKINRRMGSLYK